MKAHLDHELDRTYQLATRFGTHPLCSITVVVLQEVRRDLADSKFASALEHCVGLLTELPVACVLLHGNALVPSENDRSEIDEKSNQRCCCWDLRYDAAKCGS